MSGKIGSYKDLLVWQQSIDLAVAVYAATRDWPREELYGLTQQARRAATSVPANIAEVYGRESRPTYLNLLRIAQGSLKELETHLIIAERVGIATQPSHASLMEQSESVGKLLKLLIRKLAAN